MVRDHRTLIAIQRDARIMKRLLGMFEVIIKFRNASFEDAAEVARNKRPADRVPFRTILQAEGQR